MQTLATPFRPYAPATVPLHRAHVPVSMARPSEAPRARRGASWSTRTASERPGTGAQSKQRVSKGRANQHGARLVRLPVAVLKPADGTTHLQAVLDSDATLALAVGRTLGRRVVDALSNMADCLARLFP